MATTCDFCHVSFSSRNLFFRHLRDAATSCGGGAEAQYRMNEAPSTIRKEERQRAYAERRSRCQRDYCTKSNNAHRKQTEHCVWIGDLPLAWTRKTRQYQRLRALLRACCADSQPWILHVQRKAYKRDSVYLGYVVVAVRDDQECTELITAVEGRVCRIEQVLGTREVSSNADFRAFAEDPNHQSPFTLRARPYVQKKKEEEGGEDAPFPNGSNIRPGSELPTLESPDPPLLHQLRPLSTQALLSFANWAKGDEKERAKSHENSVSDATSRLPPPTHPEALEAAVASAVGAKEDPRCFIPCQSQHEIPAHLRDRLLLLLSTLRWPVPNHRARVVTERYMVLLTSTSLTDFLPLRQACRELMEWYCAVAACDFFEYSAIAVTKNFVGSPHIDERDTTVQYAVSVGDFTGGELCVQGRTLDAVDDIHPNAVYVVNTHNRMACVDGRHVHWVRPWTAAQEQETTNRYSLIFYSTDPQQATPIHPLGVLLHGHAEIVGGDQKPETSP